MQKDEIIAEVWRNCDAYARAHNNTLAHIFANLRRRQQAHPERVVDRRAQRRPGTNAVSR